MDIEGHRSRHYKGGHDRQTPGGQVADKDCRRRGPGQEHKADIRWTHGGHKADKWRTRTEGANNTRRTSGGHKPDTWRTSSGDAARAYRGQPFFLRENPTVNCLGNEKKNKNQETDRAVVRCARREEVLLKGGDVWAVEWLGRWWVVGRLEVF